MWGGGARFCLCGSSHVGGAPSALREQAAIPRACSIIILTKFLLCESGYFDHIVNSFRNHYKLDILEDARKLLELNTNFITSDIENDPLFAL